MLKPMLHGCLWVACAALLGGCQHSPLPHFSDDGQLLEKPVGEGYVPDPASPIPDVPKPVGAVLLEDQSVVHVENGLRYVLHRYQVRGDAGDAVLFYRTYLPEHGWKPVAEEPVGDVAVLRYRKDPEDLTVKIARPRPVVTIVVEIRNPQMQVAPAGS